MCLNLQSEGVNTGGPLWWMKLLESDACTAAQLAFHLLACMFIRLTLCSQILSTKGEYLFWYHLDLKVVNSSSSSIDNSPHALRLSAIQQPHITL